MIIGTANIKNFPDMSRTKVQADGKKMSSICDLWGMQENNPVEDLPAIMDVLGDDWKTVHPGTDIPFLYRDSVFNLVESTKIVAPFEPVLPLTPRPRWITGAVFELKNRPGVQPFGVVNVHLIAGGYNGDNSPSDTARRIRQWDIEWLTAKSLLHTYREEGFTVFLLGDLNNPNPPKPIPNWRWLVGERLDKIGVSTNGSVLVEENQNGTVDLNSDHRGQWSNVWLSAS